MSFVKWGRFEVALLDAGRFALDGGAMFGVVPKVLWGKMVDSDADNRVPLALNCLLVRAPEGNILVDTGCGGKMTEKQRNIYHLKENGGLSAALKRHGLSGDDIDLVVNTHLHFDHCGGNTVIEGDRPVPAFPRARYLVQETELREAEEANERNRASYLPENWRPLLEADCLDTVNGAVEVVAGFHLEPTPGHTLGHQSVRLTGDEEELFFAGDLFPTAAHVSPAWIPAYDVFPLATLETRKKIYQRALAGHWRVVLEHEPGVPVGRIVEEKPNRFTFQPEPW